MNSAQLLRKIKFDKEGLVPAVIQDEKTKKVLMVAYMNKLALKKTLQTGKTHFWSRSRKKLWIKGERSGHTQVVRQVFLDCDNDTVLIKVRQKRAACHRGYYSCFYKNINRSTMRIRKKGKKVFDPKAVYPVR